LTVNRIKAKCTRFCSFPKQNKIYLYLCMHTFLIWLSFSPFLSFSFILLFSFSFSLSVIFFFIFFFSFYALSNKLRCYILLHWYWLSNCYTNLDILYIIKYPNSYNNLTVNRSETKYNISICLTDRRKKRRRGKRKELREREREMERE